MTVRFFYHRTVSGVPRDAQIPLTWQRATISVTLGVFLNRLVRELEGNDYRVWGLVSGVGSLNEQSSHHRVVSGQPHDAQTMANRSLTHVQTAKYVSDSTHQTAHKGTERNGYRGAGPSERYLSIPRHT